MMLKLELKRIQGQLFSICITRFQSEQSGSELSLNENGHSNGGLLAGEEADDLYETPITTIENQTAESGSNDEESHLKRVKTERANTEHDYDDYEMQEKLLADSLQQTGDESQTDKAFKSKRHSADSTSFSQDDFNESNV